MVREDRFRNSGWLNGAVVLALLLYLGGAGSLATEADPQAHGTVLVPEAITMQDDAVDLIIHVADGPPSYADETTGQPASVVLTGQTVQWRWEGGLPHSVTTDADLSVGSEGPDSGIQRLDEHGNPFTFEVTFSQPGVYKVFCEVHLPQHGVVVVV